MKVFIVLLFSVLVLSCSNKPSLQKYFVENTESKDFIAIDVSSGILNTDKISLSESETAALKTFDKINVIAFKKDSINDSKYNEEIVKVKAILKGEEYEQLMKFGSSNQGATIYLVGDDEKIDEFVIYANNKTSGFAIVRILGNNMNPNDIMSIVNVMQKSNMNLDQLKPLEGLFK